MYFVVVAARDAASLPATFPALSLFTDSNDAELERVDHQAREVMRLDALLRTRDAELREFVRHARELEEMVKHRDHQVGEVAAELREQIAALVAERDRLRREIDAQERIIAYRASGWWWLKLPLIRMRRLWNRIRTA
jgi:chromosome segregation ATPase